MILQSEKHFRGFQNLSEISRFLPAAHFVQKPYTWISADVVARLRDLEQAEVGRFPERDVVRRLPGAVPQSRLQAALRQQKLEGLQRCRVSRCELQRCKLTVGHGVDL